ncbi:MAG TPA: hypothetical protein PLO43_02175 [Chlamydiales bacterium]|nr:hypothetical protein [Chlamydiales bacterium]
MAVFDISEFQQQYEEKQAAEAAPTYSSKKDKLLSSLLARGLFFLLLIVDIAWCFYSLALYLVTLPWGGLTRGFRQKRALCFKRSLICAVALFTALFSPAIGIMFGCTYFMVFDKSGIDEVIPSSLKSQFEEFFPG